MNTINSKITFKDLIKILKNHQSDMLMSAFLISIIFCLIYSFIPVSPYFFYRVGKFIADVLLGYVVGYIIYFLTSTVPYDTRVFSTNKLLKKRFDNLKEDLDLLIKDISGNNSWLVIDNKSLFLNIQQHNKDRNVISEEVDFFKDPNGRIRMSVPKFEYYSLLTNRIESTINSIYRYSQYIVRNTLIDNLNNLHNSEFHDWLKGLNQYPKFSQHDFESISFKMEKEDYLYTVKQIFSEMDKQINYG